MTIQDRMNDVEFELLQDDDFQVYCNACEHAIANFTGDDDIDPTVVELVAQLAMLAMDEVKKGDHKRAEGLIEKAATFVQADLDEGELCDWVGEMDTQLNDYGLVGFL